MIRIMVITTIAFVVTACITEVDKNVYDGDRLANYEELSAEGLTIFNSSIMAFDTPSDVVANNPILYSRFLSGDALYETPRIANTTDTVGMTDDQKANLKRFGGLGPLYVGFACISCHQGAGRTKSTLHTHGGSGNSFSSFLAFIRSKNNQTFKDVGRVLHDHAVFPEKPEGKLKVQYTEKCEKFPNDDDEYCLLHPKYSVTDWYPNEIAESDLEMSVRTPLRHVGMGLMMAVDDNEVLELAAKSYPEFGISGEANWVFEKGKRCLGRSGHKANHCDLTVELGFLSDMGVTNERFPFEVSEGQPQVHHDFGIEVTTADMADVEFYMFNLGVPARRNVKNPEVMKGEKAFYKAKCHLCHTPTLHTSSIAPKLMDGTRLPHLSNKTIHPYTDYLLHDMGAELGDDFDQGTASGREWRTAPLWSIGLQETVNGHTYFLHDARARNLKEAIMWHGGEGDVSRTIYKNMAQEERAALHRFIESL